MERLLEMIPKPTFSNFVDPFMLTNILYEDCLWCLRLKYRNFVDDIKQDILNILYILWILSKWNLDGAVEIM